MTEQSPALVKGLKPSPILSPPEQGAYGLPRGINWSFAEAGRGRPRGAKARRRDDVALVTGYHQAHLQKLLEHLRDGFRRYEEGALDAFQLDAIVHQYTAAARELWKFCGDLSGSRAASTARALRATPADAEGIDWWERGGRRAPG